MGKKEKHAIEVCELTNTEGGINIVGRSIREYKMKK